MSLHALAGHMASKGRGSDSMLVHMTPEEVQSLQVLALKGGGTLTINPDTGLPEANFLKKMLPMIAGFALAPLTAGTSLAFLGATPLASAMTVGGITGLATGSLSRGLMAGLGAYGGASLGAGLAGAGAGAAQEAAVAGISGEQLAQQAAAQGLTEQGVLNQAARTATDNFLAQGAGSQLAQGATAAFNNPSSLVQSMGGAAKTFGAAYAGLSPMLAADTVQTTTKRPDTGYIRNYTFDPYGQTYSDAGSYPASEYKGMAQGGIVALAAGGVPAKIDQNYVNQLVKEAATQAGGTLSFADASNAARNLGISEDMLRSAASNTGFITGAPASVAGPAAGSAAYNSMVGNFFSNPNVTSADVDSAISTYGLNRPDVLNAMDAVGLSKAAQFAAFQPDVGVSSAPLGGLAGLSSNINAALGNFRGVEGRAPTRAEAEAAMGLEGYNERDFIRATGMTLDEYFKEKKKPLVVPTTIVNTATQIPDGGSGGGNTIVNPNGTITTRPNIPGIPEGGFTGMGQVRDAYTEGGGSLGYVNKAPEDMAEFEQRFNKQTGDSLAAYEYLMGRGANPIKSGVGEIMRPYSEAVRGIPAAEGRPTQKYIFDPVEKKYVENPNYIPMSFNSKGERSVGMTSNEVLKGFNALPNKSDDAVVFDWMNTNNVTLAQMAKAMGITLAEAQRRRDAAAKKKTDAAAAAAATVDGSVGGANGGLMGMAAGGYAVGGGLGALAGGGSTSQYNLGSYSDGGRLLRGPGDGVSDSIPASIGGKQPARLADGEFVVPARIVSELGNGSTEAGARKLYAMMDRVQKARRKTTGKNRVAANTRSEKFLPA
jgi:hypothetical protein